MERAAVRRRLTWQPARVVALVSENARTQSIVLDPLDWPGHLAGQHVDVRLTAEDGYQAQRSYSIASAPEDDHLSHLTLAEVPVFADRLGVAPAIVVGRLQHDGLLPFSHGNKLRRRFRFG